jgi:hypothetical protein
MIQPNTGDEDEDFPLANRESTSSVPCVGAR